MYTESNGTDWKWTDGTPVDYVNWELGEPNNPTTEHCSDLWTGLPCNSPTFNYAPSEFNDEGCNITILNFICKKPINKP